MKIAVYCSARGDIGRECFADAERLGRWIGGNGHTLVYGGLAMGLMDAVAGATAGTGGRVMGVVPEARLERQHPANTVNIPVCSLHERKQVMEENADVFVALDGGYGTLDEVMSALASMSFFGEPKPLLLLNRNGLYDPLLEMFGTMVRRGLMYADVPGRIVACASVEELISELDRLTGNN